MNTEKNINSIALIGGGPSALYFCKHFIDYAPAGCEIHIFEKTDILGAGMPYSAHGSNEEHVANVSANEIPELVSTVDTWIQEIDPELLRCFHINPLRFNEYKVLPRLFLGAYLSAQFNLLIDKAKNKNIDIHVHLNDPVLDIKDKYDTNEVWVKTHKHGLDVFNKCVICTGHLWPKKHEKKIKGYYDSPYPPSKLLIKADHPVAIRGSSLTAIDAIRTLSRTHGTFSDTNGFVSYKLSDENKSFRMILHSSKGMFPAIRIHMQEPQVSSYETLTPESVSENRKQHDGFLSLDFVFETAFKQPLKKRDPVFYARIAHMNMEAFVDAMMKSRERQDPFVLFEKEYKEAEKSIHQHAPIYWKEMLSALSFAMNYPAKYFSAEDMQRLQKTLSEMISIVIAFVPQDSARELLALHAAGILNIVDVDSNSHVDPVETGGIVYHYTDEHQKPVCMHYHTFVDAIGQKHLPIEAFPFKTLLNEKTIAQARLKFKDVEAAKKEIANGNKDVIKKNDGTYYMNVSGIAINDHFQLVNEDGFANERIYIMAVPFISGYNPDYSGLDFCNKAAQLICEHLIHVSS